MNMIKILAIQEARTEHAKEVRRQTGTNDYRDKAIFFRDNDLMQCIGSYISNAISSIAKDFMIIIKYE